MSALVLTALMAVAEAMGWARVEVLTPGETIRILFDSGQTEQRFFVGADSHTLFVLAPGFDRLTRSARRSVIDCLAHAPALVFTRQGKVWSVGTSRRLLT